MSIRKAVGAIICAATAVSSCGPSSSNKESALYKWTHDDKSETPPSDANASNQNTSPVSATSLAKAEADFATALKDPKKVALIECMGIKVYQDPQPPGHPPSPEQCKKIEGQASYVGALLAQESKLDDQCKDGSGDDTATVKVCADRDRVFAKLQSLGWCYGESGQAMYQMKWHQCATENAAPEADASDDTGALATDPSPPDNADKGGIGGYDAQRYCQYYRASLPKEQQTICTLRDQAATNVQAHASSELLAYEKGSNLAMKSLALASAAVQCGIRSENWFDTIKTGFSLAADVDMRRFHLSDEEVEAANLVGQKIYTDTISHTKCSELVDSPDMDKLDSIQVKLTGDYH